MKSTEDELLEYENCSLLSVESGSDGSNQMLPTVSLEGSRCHIENSPHSTIGNKVKIYTEHVNISRIQSLESEPQELPSKYQSKPWTCLQKLLIATAVFVFAAVLLTFTHGDNGIMPCHKRA